MEIILLLCCIVINVAAFYSFLVFVYMAYEVRPVLFTKLSQFHFSIPYIKTIEAYRVSKIEMVWNFGSVINNFQVLKAPKVLHVLECLAQTFKRIEHFFFFKLISTSASLLRPSLTWRVPPSRLILQGPLISLWILRSVYDLLLSLTHPQSPAFARYSEIPTTTLLTDGHLTFRGHVSTFWRKTAPPLPRPFRCWWRTMHAGPAPSPGPSRWTWCWAPAPSASSSTWPCAGTARASRCPARRHSSTSTWMATSWKWRPKQVGFCVPLPPRPHLTNPRSSTTWARCLFHGGQPGGRGALRLQGWPPPRWPGLPRDASKMVQKSGRNLHTAVLQSGTGHTGLAICWHPCSKNSICLLQITSFSCFVAMLGPQCPAWNCQCFCQLSQ